jgi:hypothetical protein
VFADFLAYLYRSARCSDHGIAPFEEDTTIVLCHPDGLQSSQMQQMKRAAIQAGLVNLDGSSVEFVTNGAAGLHFCLEENKISSEKLKGRAIGIINAGALRTDMLIYSLDSSPRRIVELAAPICILQCSSSITSRGKAYVEENLRGTVENMAACFHRFTLPLFKNGSYTEFSQCRDDHLTITMDRQRGWMEISRTKMAKFFEPLVQAIADSIRHQKNAARKPVAVKFAPLYSTDPT